MDREGSIKLLAAILADLPQLTGASCIGRHRMFDPVLGNGHQYRDQERARLAKAARLCATCPVIRHCPTVTVLTELKEPA